MRSRLFRYLGPTFFCAAACCQSSSQTALPRASETVTVVAEPVPLQSLAGSVTSLSQQDLASTGARDASEALRFVPSVHFSQQSGKGSLSTVSIRGGKPNFTMVLIDGVPANDIGDQLGGAFNFATLDSAQVERIDIYRGPLSTVYASGATSGVINVVLRPPAESPRVYLGLEGGQYGYARGNGGLALRIAGLDVAANGSFSRIGQQVFEDASMLGTAGLAADRNFGATKGLHSFIRWNRLSDSSLPVSSGGPLYAISRLPEIELANQVSAGGQYRQTVNRIWSFAANGGIFSRVASDNSPSIFDKLPPGPSYVPSSISRTRFLRSEGATTHTITPLSWLTSHTTVSFLDEAGTTRGSLGGTLPGSFHLSRGTFNLSQEADVHGRHGAVTGGFNFEHTGQYGSFFSSHAGGLLPIGRAVFHLSYGTGFKLPSFYSLGNPLVGNPALQPETSHGLDTGVSAHLLRGDTQLSLTYFDNGYGNLIDFSPSLFRLLNRKNAFARGSDLSGTTHLRKLTLTGAVTYLDCGLQGTTDRLRDLPRWSEELRGHLVLPKDWSVDLGTVWVGRRFDYQVPVPKVPTVPRYALTNLEVSKVLRKGLVTHLRIENLFNKKYQEFLGFPAAGIYVSAGFSYSR